MAEEYASHAQGTATTTLSAITTGLLALGNGNGLSGLFGGGSNASTLALAQKEAELAQVRSEYAMTEKVNKSIVDTFTALRQQDKEQDSKIAAIQAQVNAINVSNATMAANLACLQNTVNSVVVPRIPNSMLCPGYGTAVVTPPSTSSSGSGS